MLTGLVPLEWSMLGQEQYNAGGLIVLVRHFKVIYSVLHSCDDSNREVISLFVFTPR